MTTKITLTLAAIGTALGFALSTPASAGDDYRHGRGHDKHWKHHHHHRGHGYDRIVRERVVVERPVYVERYVTYAPPPPPRYPGIVVNVDLPPLYIPFR